MKYKCSHCGFKANVESNHQLTNCPVCKGDGKEVPIQSFSEKLRNFGDWLAEPVMIYEYCNTGNPELIKAYAQLKSSEAEIMRARKKLPEPQHQLHQHIHVDNKEMKRIAARMQGFELLGERNAEESDY